MARKKIGKNKWLVTVSVRDKHKGYPISKQRTVIGTEADAKITESDLLKELRARSLTSAHASTFGDALDLQLEHLRTEGTLAQRHEAWYERLRRDLGHVRLEDFPTRYKKYLESYEQRVTLRGKYPSGATLNRFTALVRAVFNRLVKKSIIDKNPITTEEFPKRKEYKRNRYLSQEERYLLFATIRQHRPYILPIVQYMLSVPCRVSELTYAERWQYSPLRKTVFIPHSKAGFSGHKPIPPDMLEYFNTIPADCPYLFYQYKDGQYYSLEYRLKTAWNYCLKKAGITDLRIHDLRHIAATDMILAGNSEQVVMKAAIWKTNMLSTYYHDDSLFSAQQAVFAPQITNSDVICCAS